MAFAASGDGPGLRLAKGPRPGYSASVEPDAGGLADEIRRLKNAVTELEEKYRLVQSRAEHEDTTVSNVVRLLRQKDSRLGEMDEELAQKNAQLEKLVDQLRRKNQELSTWIASLRLYQDIFENEPAIMIGLNLEGRILLFNKAAGEHFGDTIRSALMKDFDALELGRLDPAAPALIRRALTERKMLSSRSGGGETLAIPIRTGAEVKGVLLKMTLSGR